LFQPKRITNYATPPASETQDLFIVCPMLWPLCRQAQIVYVTLSIHSGFCQVQVNGRVGHIVVWYDCTITAQQS